MKNIFLSDLHIGVDAPTNLYQSKIHEPSLKAILKYIQENGNDINDLVILGDWIDLWMYTSNAAPMAAIPAEDQLGNFLPTVDQIIEANPTLFTPQTDPSLLGDFISCLDSIQGTFYYVNGNHDISVTGDQINSYFKKYSAKGREISWIDCSKSPVSYTSAIGDIHCEHGHWYSMVCRPYKNEALPFGYYITRAGMNAAVYLKGPLPPLNLDQIKKTMKDNNQTLAQAMLTIVAGQANNTMANLNFTMPDGTTISASDAAAKFPDLDVDDSSFVLTDVMGTLDDSAAQLFTDNPKLKIVVFGHTHLAKVIQDFHVLDAYSNTGFLCGGNPDAGTALSLSTFVEIEDNTGTVLTAHDAPYTVTTYKVDFASATITLTPPLCSTNIYNYANLALYKPATASSVELNTNFTPDLAVDGNNSTRWSSQYSDPQWLQVDLGQLYDINGVTLSWEAAYAVSYNIQVSNDAVTWTDVYSTTTGAGGTENISFPTAQARYVRMYGTQRVKFENHTLDYYGYSLYEFRVFASQTTPTAK